MNSQYWLDQATHKADVVKRNQEIAIRSRRAVRLLTWGGVTLWALAALLGGFAVASALTQMWPALGIALPLAGLAAVSRVLFIPDMIQARLHEIETSESLVLEKAQEVTKAMHQYELAKWQEDFQELLPKTELPPDVYSPSEGDSYRLIDLTDWRGDFDPRRQWAKEHRDRTSRQSWIYRDRDYGFCQDCQKVMPMEELADHRYCAGK